MVLHIDDCSPVPANTLSTLHTHTQTVPYAAALQLGLIPHISNQYLCLLLGLELSTLSSRFDDRCALDFPPGPLA